MGCSILSEGFASDPSRRQTTLRKCHERSTVGVARPVRRLRLRSERGGRGRFGAASSDPEGVRTLLHRGDDDERAARGVPGLLRGARAPARGGALADPARGGSDDALHHRRHAAVQAVLPADEGAAEQPRGQRSALPARRGQGQRPRRGGAHRPPLLLLRDDGQLLVRRLLQGRGRRLRVGLGHSGARPRAGAPLGDRPRGRSGAGARRGHRRDRGLAAGRHPERAHRPARQGQLLAGGRDGPVRSVHRDLLRPRRGVRLRRPELRAGSLRPDHGDLQPRLHGVRPPAGKRARAAADAERRHRQRHRADRVRAAGRQLGLRHRRLPGDHGLDRARVGRRLSRQRRLTARAPRARRSWARRHAS